MGAAHHHGSVVQMLLRIEFPTGDTNTVSKAEDVSRDLIEETQIAHFSSWHL